MDRAKFYDGIRHGPFPGKLTGMQVHGIEVLLDEWWRRKPTDLRWLAYLLATSFHETGHTMLPVFEKGPRKYFDKYDGRKDIGNVKPGDGFLFRGRGHAQITGRSNYTKFAKRLGVDLVGNPDLALEPAISATILFDGVLKGLFTGKKLSEYIAGPKADWRQARRTVNGLDRADLIAGYAKQFYADLQAAV